MNSTSLLALTGLGALVGVYGCYSVVGALQREKEELALALEEAQTQLRQRSESKDAGTATVDVLDDEEHLIHLLETPTATSLHETTVSHNHELPFKYIEMIPLREKQVLAFILSFLKTQQLPVDSILINGGYVRDLLLHQIPDDLDITLCLRDCAPDVTVDSILRDLEAFPEQHPEFDVVAVKSTTITSDESKNKMIDTAKANISMKCGTVVEVDLMPTIGQEQYDDSNNRIPVRDHRGTTEDDALRRDLTIGCLFISVSWTETGQLRWVLLDYYGGLQDLDAQLLRSPFPVNVPVNTMANQVIHSPEDFEVAGKIGLGHFFETRCGCSSVDLSQGAISIAIGDDAETSDANDGLELVEQIMDVRQVLWWIKILKDDPLRILRTLRFAGKLEFEIHPSFWVAVPFALQSLRSKVAGERKFTEMTKLAKLGKAHLLQFFQLAFNITFHGPSSFNDRLGPFLFGGKSTTTGARFLGEIESFDGSKFMRLFQYVPVSSHRLSVAIDGTGVAHNDALIGVLLAMAVDCSTFVGQGSPEVGSAEDADLKLDQFSRACDGLCASNSMRTAGTAYLGAKSKLVRLLVPAESSAFELFHYEFLFARALGMETRLFQMHCVLWEEMKMAKCSTSHYLEDLVVEAVGMEAPDKVLLLKSSLRLLKKPGSSLRGSCLVGLKRDELPQHLRGSMLTCLHVFSRCAGHHGNLHTTDELRAFLATQDSLLEKLKGEWFTEGGQVSDAYKPKKKSKKKNK